MNVKEPHQICNTSHQQNCEIAQNKSPEHTIRIEIPTPEYNKLLKLAIQQCTTVEQLVAQNIRHLSE